MTALSYSVPTAATVTGLSAKHLRDAIHAGDLKAKRSGRDEQGEPCGKFVIPAADLKAYIDGLADA